MNGHGLKQSTPAQSDPEGRKQAIHKICVSRLGLSTFRPLVDFSFIEPAKQGRFHQSSAAIALYTNAYTQKAMFLSSEAPFGYINKTPGGIFSFGVYRRNDGNLFGSILPLSSNLEAIAEFTRRAMHELPLRGVYVRFLRWEQHARLVSTFGFRPAKEEPWLPDAPEEDESLSHSRVDLVKLISPGSPQPIYPPLRSNVARAFNFLQRTGMDYRLVPLTPGDIPTAMDIVRKHFEMIEAKGKLVGSTFDDYLGLLHPDLQSLKSVSSYLGILGSLPISVFICESNGLVEGQPCMSGYAGITLRNINYLLGSSRGISAEPFEEPDASDLDEEQSSEPGSSVFTGASAMPSYAFFRLFSLCYEWGYRYFYMGGSEHADIDTWKHKRMGAEKDPTYWAVYI